MKIFIIGYEMAAYDSNMRSLDAPMMPFNYYDVIDIPLGRPRRSKMFHVKVKFIEVVARGDCWLDIGKDPEARPNNSYPVFAGERRYFGVFPTHYLSVLGMKDDV